MRNEPQIAIVKLAAIGDVVIACRALVDFATQHEAPVTFHWIIDHRLEHLSKAVVTQLTKNGPPIKVKWHPIDSAKLFKGTAAEKARETLDLFHMVRRIQPRHLVLLHRDWRYRLFLRPSFKGELFSLKREEVNELDAYSNCLRKLAGVMGLRSRPVLISDNNLSTKSGTIGVLVGGAQNQKLTYQEKRWPHMRRLVELVLSNTDSRIALFGGPEDLETAHALVKGLPQSDRIENLVGKLKLHELPAKLQALDGFVSIDSGLAHIAAVLMTAKHQKVVTLFGPTSPKVWAPRSNGHGSVRLMYKSKECSPCYLDDGNFKPCAYQGEKFQHCMTDITPEEVLAELRS